MAFAAKSFKTLAASKPNPSLKPRAETVQSELVITAAPSNTGPATATAARVISLSGFSSR